MFEIIYNPTYEFSSLDIFDYSDSPPFTFEAHSRQAPEWGRLFLKWEKDGYKDVDQALELVGMAIVSVSQNGQSAKIEGRAGAEELRDAVEKAAPGYGDTWIKNLARGHYFFHFRRADAELGNSKEPLPTSGDGSDPEQ